MALAAAVALVVGTLPRWDAHGGRADVRAPSFEVDPFWPKRGEPR